MLRSLLAILIACSGTALAGQMAPALEPLPEGLLWTRADLARAADHTAQPHDFKPFEQAGVSARSGRLLVKLKPKADAPRARALQRIAPVAMDSPSLGLFSLRVPDGSTEEQLADALLATGDYLWAEPDWRLSPAAEPNDKLFASQYHHGAGAMNTVGAWNMVRGDPSVVIAVVDTGVDKFHKDLVGLMPGYNAITMLTEAQGGDISPITNHGTWVMGALGANGNNGIGVAGTGWGFGLLPIRVASAPNGSALSSEIVHAATWAADHGADIINVSYTGSWATAVGELGDQLRSRGVLIAWAAGNLGSPLVTQDWPGITIVGSTNTANRIASFSNSGPGLDIVAPGEGIYTTHPDGKYASINGTSLSAPLVCGAMGLIWSADRSLTAAQVEQALFDTATDRGLPGRDQTYGWGLMNVGEAVGSVFTGQVVLPVPFIDPLDSVLDPVVWPAVMHAAMSSEAAEEPTGDSSVRIEPGGHVTTARFEADGANGLSVRWFDSASNDSAMTLSYTDTNGQWHELSRTLGGGLESARFGWHAATLPPQALHNELRLRWSAAPWSGPVYLDAIAIENPRSIDPPWRATFDEALGSPALKLFDGAAIVSGVPSASGESVLRLPDGASAESLEVLTLLKWGLAGVTDARLGVWVRPVGPAGSLVIEVEGFVGWSAVGTIPAAGLDPGRMTRWEIPLPATMLVPGDVKLRLRADGGTWDADTLFVTRGSPVSQAVCPGDLNLDGVADHSDLVAFASMYAVGDPGADITGDGLIDATDVLAFVQVFIQGCGP